ncbi:snaclec bothroinsularin subunit alpha [Exaiptasia diaphana]|uniref:C-type lectin domain-containing protein n=1 Tax=Exaiptasia diaphana TaxID=2652724 RepID=A0A913YA53_EXADI|nr:snaclec bothroinsularin subunit alpha [Exaiptasia diaphana]
MHDNKNVPCKLKNLPEELTNIFFTDLGNGWFRYGKAAIKLFTERKNWTDARSHCQSLGGDLLSITSSHENDFVHDVFVENLNLTFLQDLNEHGVWIGLNNPEGSAGFSWSDGTPVGQFMNLPNYNPEPNKTGRKCVAMAKDKKWLDKHCDLKYPFLCEKPAPP